MIKLKALLFDLDGTLINSDMLHFQSWRLECASFGLELDQESYKSRMSGRPNETIMQEFLPHLTTEQVTAFILSKELRYREMAVSQLAPLPGVLRVLDWAKTRKLYLALVTNAPRVNTEFALTHLSLQSVFDKVVTIDDVRAGKPDPLPYLTALEQLGVHAQESLVFEDSPSGIQAANSAGLDVIGVEGLLSAEELLSQGVIQAIPDFETDYLWHTLKARFAD